MEGDDVLVGKDLGAYRVEATIGSGATGVVYRASRQDGSAPVALKVLHENLGSITGLERRFRREARVLKKLSHPNIVEIEDFGISGGRTFIAMELLEGETLEERLDEGPIDPLFALEIYEPVLEALAVAHTQDVVHRDLKPANVFLESDGDVKLVDFGLAKMLSVDETTTDEGTLTRRGRIVGTPAYMAPEQITGVFIDVRADVYALGVMLYELLADRRPFVHERRSELLRAHLLEPVKSITEAREGLWVHPALAAIIERCLEKDAGKRFSNAAEMLAALRALPERPVRLGVSPDRSGERLRMGTTSAVISAAEREQVTASAGLSAHPVHELDAPPPTPPPSAPAGGEGASGAEDAALSPLIASAAGETRGVPTAALYLLALLLIGGAAGLWAAWVAS